jgi:hypothetical protein
VYGFGWGLVLAPLPSSFPIVKLKAFKGHSSSSSSSSSCGHI